MKVRWIFLTLVFLCLAIFFIPHNNGLLGKQKPVSTSVRGRLTGISVNVEGTYVRRGGRLTVRYECFRCPGDLVRQGRDKVYLHRSGQREEMGLWRILGSIARPRGTLSLNIPRDMAPAKDYEITIWFGSSCYGRSESFSIGPFPYELVEIPNRISRPRRNQAVYYATDLDIQWNSTGGWGESETSRVSLSLIDRSGRHIMNISDPTADDHFVWRVGMNTGGRYEEVPLGAGYKIRMTKGSPEESCESQPFTLRTPTVTVDTPYHIVGGVRSDFWYRGDTLDLHWTVSPSIPDFRNYQLKIYWRGTTSRDYTASRIGYAEGENFSWTIPTGRGPDTFPHPSFDTLSCYLEVEVLLPRTPSGRETDIKGSSRGFNIGHH